MKKSEIGELFHPNTELSVSDEISIYGSNIKTEEFGSGGNIGTIGIGNERPKLGAIMGDIEEMDGNIITKFKLTGVSIIPKLRKGGK